MRNVTLTAFRSHISGLLTDVENGETLIVIRHGRPIAEVSPVSGTRDWKPSWTGRALRLSTRGASLSAAIREER